ncbi:hypothetical protein Htur_3842 (plasmid) [Haloterrigena turkmenica DSM 5511]|uniref:UGSC-like domain-containing protein n=1 Tax=Haloterrigena turkmenica (strain ATCC 51198 / DSM 5511 / JCM 9101 / NCIMB 13204 / VKM B-1734 / 4k) TaxID=543526 RepID=D2S005_HALTV|nr:hypothetical protein [Haloterrigena turkmenica]ADB62702.1 hypothetical protein Htur_3842 [Haloterrigena turkmenica DSM 5511]
MYDPVADSEKGEQESLAPRIKSLEGKRIGLFNNGKLAATPLLEVVQERLKDEYPDATIEHYEVEHLNRIKNEDELSSIRQWADEEVDACFGAIGDCGSCTKFLVYGVNAIEEGGTPAVGLIDEGFELDWKTNARDFGRKLRFHPLSRVAEVTDKERLREQLTADALEEIVAELTRPRTDEERNGEEIVANGEK